LIIHGFAKNESDAAYRAVSAGVNVEHGQQDSGWATGWAGKKRKITVAQIDDAVRPVLAVKIRMGLFETPVH